MDNAKNTTGQAQLLTESFKHPKIYLAGKEKGKDNQGEEVSTEEKNNTKADNRGQSTKGGKEEENKHSKDTNQTKPSKELTTKQTYLLLTADLEQQTLNKVQKLQRCMENKSEEKRSTDNALSHKN